MRDKLVKLLDKLPGEGASDDEVAALLDKVMAEPGGLEAIRELAAEVAGINPARGEGAPVGADRPPLPSPLRLLIRGELLGARPAVWRRFSLPADCSFFHLHHALRDAFGWHESPGHRFEIHEDGQLEVIFRPAGGGEPDEAVDCYDELAHCVQDLFHEEVGEFLYLPAGRDGDRCRVVVEDVVGAGMAGTSRDRSPCWHDGAGRAPTGGKGGQAFDPAEVVFRDPDRLG